MTLLAALGLITLVALTVSFDIWWLPVATIALIASFALIRRLSPQSPLRRASMAAMARVSWVAAVAVLVIAAFVQTPWVPLEQIKTTDRTITGYVLSVDSGYLNILTDEHKFAILVSSDVVSRT